MTKPLGLHLFERNAVSFPLQPLLLPRPALHLSAFPGEHFPAENLIAGKQRRCWDRNQSVGQLTCDIHNGPWTPGPVFVPARDKPSHFAHIDKGKPSSIRHKAFLSVLHVFSS
jgi:hypothetical protein